MNYTGDIEKDIMTQICKDEFQNLRNNMKRIARDLLFVLKKTKNPITFSDKRMAMKFGKFQAGLEFSRRMSGLGGWR